jgi:hypothetical protein
LLLIEVSASVCWYNWFSDFLVEVKSRKSGINRNAFGKRRQLCSRVLPRFFDPRLKPRSQYSAPAVSCRACRSSDCTAWFTDFCKKLAVAPAANGHICRLHLRSQLFTRNAYLHLRFIFLGQQQLAD